MVAHADIFKGVQYGKYNTSEELQQAMAKYIDKTNDEVIYVCIGTDRSTGDSLAPFIGNMLQEKGYNNVYGTIDNPIHGVNLDYKIEQLPKDKTIIAIDASLGKSYDIGMFTFNKGELYPGQGVGKNLTPIGDYHITGIVNASGYMEYMVLQNTRLREILNMAKKITCAIENAFPLQNEIKLLKVL